MVHIPVIKVRLEDSRIVPASRDKSVTLKDQDAVVAPVPGPASPKSFAISSPVVGDNLSIFFTKNQITVNTVNAVVRGSSPSVNFSLKYGPDRSQTGYAMAASIDCSNTTSGNVISTFNQNIIPKNNFIWLVINSVTGTVNELAVSIDFS